MKKIITLAMIAISFSVFADNHEEYKQFQSILITPDYAKLATLTENMAKHNKKYHSKEPYDASVYNVVTGKDVGKIYWFMGSATFAELDKRPSGKGHDEDWAKNIMPYVKKLQYGEYWRVRDGLEIDNYKNWEKKPLENWMVRYMTVAPGKSENVEFLLGRVKETLEKTGKVQYWAILENRFLQGQKNGRHLQGVSTFNKWGEMDDNWEFKKHFTELYGEDAWDPFWDMWRETFSNEWHEVQVLNKKMSGME